MVLAKEDFKQRKLTSSSVLIFFYFPKVLFKKVFEGFKLTTKSIINNGNLILLPSISLSRESLRK